MAGGRRSGQITIGDLAQRATGGHTLNRHILFRPSIVYQVLNDPFWIWCENHAPKAQKVDETTRYDELRYQQGIEYEQNWVQENYPHAVKIEPDFGYDALKNTLKAMLEGVPAIYQPHLWALGHQVYGKGDLLVREESQKSDLGPYHYRVVEIKRSRSLRDEHSLQAALYNWMLGMIQGYTPEEMSIVLKEKNERVAYDQGSERALEEIISTWKELRDGLNIPEPGRPPDSTSSPWRIYGNRWVKENNHLVLLAGINAKERQKLRGAGIHRIDQLWNLSLEAVSEMLGNYYGTMAYYVAQAYRTSRPIQKPSCSLNIPRSKRHLYFDFETSDGVHPSEPPHVYLIGVWNAEAGEFAKFLGRGAEDEKRIFSEFLKFLGDLRETRLYHWTDFEIGKIMEVLHRWPDLQDDLNQLIARCVDLKEVIKKSIYLPVPNYSIKSVGPALGFHWQDEVFGAYHSMVTYWDYLDHGDDTEMHKVIQYNKDDCMAMSHVDRELAKYF